MNKGLVVAIAVIVVVVGVAGFFAYKAYATPSSTHTDITFTGWVSSGEEYTFDLQMVNTFNQEHNNTTVIFSPYTQNYYSQLSTAFSSNSAPSVFYMENDILPLFASHGYLANLTPTLQGNSTYNLTGFAPSILHTFYYKGSLYAAPKDWSPLLIFYNKAIFDQEKIPYPGNTTWDWTAMMSTIHQLSANESMLNSTLKTNFAPMVVDPTIDRALAYIHEAGGEWINQYGNGSVTNAQQLAGLKAGLFFYYNLTKNGVQVSSNFSAGWAGGDFAADHVGMVDEGTWTVPVLNVTGSNFYNHMNEVGYYNMPSDVQKGTMMFNVGLAINSHLTGTKKCAAEQILEFFTGPSGEKQCVSNGLAHPSRTSILDSSWYRSTFPIQAFAGDQFPNAFGWNYNTTNFNTVHTDVNTVYSNLFAGTITFQQAFDQILSTTNTDLKNSSTFTSVIPAGSHAAPSIQFMNYLEMITISKP